MSSEKPEQPPEEEVRLFGKASAAAYLGVSEVWIAKLVERGQLRVWQETKGSCYVFLEAWLQDYKATKRAVGWVKGRPRKPKPEP